MPRKRELTWQVGSDGRSGRWRKRYRGRTLYLGNASSKSDDAAYNQALANWRVEKRKIDDELGLLPKPYQAAYEEAISDWEKALEWAHDHHDEPTADRAQEKLVELRKRLSRKSPPPLEYGDRFWDSLSHPAEEIQRAIKILDDTPEAKAIKKESGGKTIKPSANGKSTFPILTRGQLEREIWKDRLEKMPVEQAHPTERLGFHMQNYLNREILRVQAKELSASRFASKRNNLLRFQDWAGENLLIESITGDLVQRFHSDLLAKIQNKKLSPNTAHDRIGDTVSFIRWLWQSEILQDLPRILLHKNNSLSISKPLSTPQVFTIAEVKKCLSKANARTKLYLLLMLNCGMYQSDISDLKQTEVDWTAGTISRKRSKTRSHASVPVVRYKLWEETFVLLKKFRAPTGERVLLNKNSGPLVDRGIKATGETYCNDAIKNAYNRLKKKTKIDKPMKLFRKTSASLIRGQAEFRGLEDLFLGLSPTSISDRHYAKPPEQLLADAIDWLWTQYDG